jgi:MHS family proline/betaine transporter-like MFS transporter
MYELADIKQQQEQVDFKQITKSRLVNEKGDSVITTKSDRLFTGGNRLVESSTRKVSKTGEPTLRVQKEILLSDKNYWIMVALVLIQVVFVTMVYGPVAAFLVELFPTRIRYTSMSLPYHIGFGIFGGLTPFIATALYEASKTESNPAGDPFAGLWYPILVAGVCFLIGMTLLKNKAPVEVD